MTPAVVVLKVETKLSRLFHLASICCSSSPLGGS
jgi:hypothetical protein